MDPFCNQHLCQKFTFFDILMFFFRTFFVGNNNCFHLISACQFLHHRYLTHTFDYLLADVKMNFAQGLSIAQSCLMKFCDLCLVEDLKSIDLDKKVKKSVTDPCCEWYLDMFVKVLLFRHFYIFSYCLFCPDK